MTLLLPPVDLDGWVRIKKLGVYNEEGLFIYNLECLPSDDKRTVTIIVSAEEQIGVQGLIKVLAQFIKYMIERDNISYDEVKLKPGDRAQEK